MNKVYKSVWNASSGQWVAASEIAKGKTKSATSAKVAGVIALTMLSTSAWAGTCTPVTGVIAGTGCATSVDDTALDVTNVISSAQITMQIIGGKATLNVTDSNITVATGFGASIAGEGAAINFKGNNTINLANSNTAVLAQNRESSTEGVSVDISGTFNLNNASNAGALGYEWDGVELVNRNGGNTDLNFNGNGKVEVVSGNALYVKNYGQENTATVNVTGVGGIVELVTTGNGSSGIFAMNGAANKSGNIIIDTDARIKTSGLDSVPGDANLGVLYANGIAAVIKNADSTGTIKVTNKGSIETAGKQAAGIRVGSAGTGKTEAFNTGNITTAGEKSHAIHSQTGNGDAEVTNNAKLITSGLDASGIRADQLAESSSGNITVNTGNNSYIETNNAQADGIHVTIGSEMLGSTAVSTGSVTVNAAGSIKTTGNGTAEGIYAAITKNDGAGGLNSGNVSVAFTGDTIETTGTGINRGIYTRQDGSGTTTVQHFGNQIKTAGDGAHGIHVLTMAAPKSGDILVESTGKINTTGNGAHGIHVASNKDMTGTTVINSGHMTVTGNDSSGIKTISAGAGDIVVRHETGATIISTGDTVGGPGTNARTDAINAYKGADATGNIDIYVGGDISTTGANRAAGAYAQHLGVGNATVIGTGNITTSASNNSSGTNLYSYGLAATVSNSANAAGDASVAYSQGTIQTGGANAFALYAGVVGKSGNSTVENSGTLKTAGNDSYGIWARNETTGASSATSGNVFINNAGSIETSGDNAHAIYANSHKGNVEIINEGTIKAIGTNARGINATTTAGTASVVNKGNISATGLSGIGIQLNVTGGDAIVQDMDNKVLTASETGILSISDMSSSVTSNSKINVDSGALLTTAALRGIDSYAQVSAPNSTGSSSVVYSGPSISLTSSTNAAADSYMIGIRASDSTSVATSTVDSTVIATGDIDVKLNNGAAKFLYGIEAITYSSGDAAIHYKGGTVNVQANSSAVGYGYGLLAWSNKSTGAGTGSATLITDAGTQVHTKGDKLTGMYIASQSGTAASGKEVFVNANSIVTTDGQSAHGIYAQAGLDAPITLINQGTITTKQADSMGIYAKSASGHIEVVNTGAIETQGASSHGIYVTTAGTGNINIANTGSIKTTHDDNDPEAAAPSKASQGIAAVTTGSGKITINNILSDTQSIQTSGANASPAIRVNVSNGGAASSGIEINQTGGKFDTRGYDGHGILALTTASSGDINVNVTNTIMDLKGRNSDGIDAQNLATGASDLDINITTNGGSITLVDPTVALGASANFGIIAYQYGAAAGDINITNNGTAITTRLGANGTSGTSIPIEATFMDAAATGHINIINTGALSSQGINAKGIRTQNTGSGHIDIKNGGTITTQGATASGIAALTGKGGAIDILNIGNIQTQGNSAHGIEATSSDTTTGDITVENYADISTQDARGIYLSNANGNVKVTATGNITTAQATANIHNHGIDAGTLHGNADVLFDQGTIKVTGTGAGGGNTIGIAAWDRGSKAADANASITLGSTAIVDASRGVSGLQIRSNGVGEINISQGAQVHGGIGQGIDMSATGTAAAQHTINNAGLVDSLNDQAIGASNATAPGTTLAINNDGTITGYLSLSDEDTTFTNNSSNSWNIRNYADTNGDGTRDTKAVAISNFGGGTDTLTNTASGTIRLSAVAGATTTDTTGEYIPVGALSSAQEGIVHGQILNLNRFENAGLIDLTDNGLAGDVLVISGGTTAGTPGNGNYISNGGAIKLDTILNQGGAISQSDILVVDNVTLGSAATKIYINPNIASTGGQTQDDGIKLVQVLGTQDTGSFTLGAPVTYGGYEYLLYPDSAAGADGWYLRNYNIADKERYDWFRNPNIGSYLGNQYAAANMFNQNILDRRDNVRAPDQTLWARANHNEINSNILKGLQAVEIQTNLIQVGADLLKRDDIVAGVYAGYGDSKIDNRSKQTGTTANGQVTGYHIGAYGSWMPEQNTGPYADLWGYYAWYDSKLTGQAQSLGATKYDSTGYALSAEVGYGFELNKKEDGSAWILEPHGQLTYTNISADDFTDKNLTRFSGNKSSGIQTRLGARLYGQLPTDQKGVSPFVEVNWLHNAMDNGVRVNNLEFDSQIGKNVGEVKIGVQGQVSDKFSVFGHFGAQRGSQNFKRHEIQLGVGLDW